MTVEARLLDEWGRRGLWRKIRSAGCLCVLTASAGLPGYTQTPAPVQAPSAETQPAKAEQTPSQPAADAKADAKPQAEALTPQQKELADDTAKLLALANELKAEMDKSTKDTLSLSVVKKADEIERLARKVRSEMKAAIGN